MEIEQEYNENNRITMYCGDCLHLLQQIKSNTVDLIITSPPYCMGKAYEDAKNDINTFKNIHIRIFDDIYRIVKPGGSICWQIGYHVVDNSIVPLDYIIYQLFTELSNEKEYPMILRNRIIWTFGHGLNSSFRFSGRHEMILWFTKGNKYRFDLDQVRVPQKYPGKRYYRGPHKGELSGNPLGKNPSDVWEIPNVKANHIEKTIHPCQYPVAVPQRLIRALTASDGLICDPFMGSGTTGVAAVIEGRRFIGAEIKEDYYGIAIERVADTIAGKAKIREDVPVLEPNPNAAVARLPDQFALVRGNTR